MLNLTSFLAPERIVHLEAGSKQEVLSRLVDLLAGTPEVTDGEALRKAIFDREKIISTGIGLGIAVPHARLKSITGLVAAVGVCRDGIDFGSIDDQPVRIIIMIAGPEDTQRDYLRLLAHIALIFKNAKLRKDFLRAETTREMYDMLRAV